MSEKKSYSQIRKEFYDKYKNIIVPKVRVYDNKRKIRLIIAAIGSSILFLLGIFTLLFLFLADDVRNDSDAQEGLLKGAGLFFFLSWLFWFTLKKGFENKIKEKIMPIVCSCFNNLKWKQDNYFANETLFVHSGVISNFTSSEYDDIFYGSYKDVNFEIIESEYWRKSGKHSYKIFDGVIVKLDMNKRFTSHTIIKPNSLMHISPSQHLKHTVLEDVVFENKFDVFTDDEVDARYLITTSFMERLNKMKIAFKADKVSCAFYGDQLFVGLETSKDIFSLCSLVKPVDDPKQYFQMYEEIVSIIKLIDHFKLDQKIGL